MKVLFFLLILFNAPLMKAQDSILLENLAGKWHVILTNFPMWTTGKKTDPTFNYSITSKNNRTVLLDEVKYLKKGKEKSIVGFDKPVNSENREFVWKGKGILFLLKSRWKILHIDKNNWMIIQFQKTLFTPKGYDVISKEKNISEQEMERMNKKLKELNTTEKLARI